MERYLPLVRLLLRVRRPQIALLLLTPNFSQVPDRWTKLDDAPDNEGDNLLEMWPDW